MSNGTETNESSNPSSRQENIRNWVDTGAKVLGAFAIAGVSYVAATYQSQASQTSIINQREQAESQLRASMLSDLIEPIIGKNENASQNSAKIGKENEEAELERQLLLAEMVTLNFHDHFEFKPLLLDVDSKLLASRKDGERGMIASDARRVIDRQINMLTSIDGISVNGRSHGYGAKVTEIRLVDPPKGKTSVAKPITTCSIRGNIVATKPTATSGPTFICVASPDNKICLLVKLTFPPDAYKYKSIGMKNTIIYRQTRHSLFGLRDENTPGCSKQQDNIQTLDEVHLSIFDFPLTDNSKIMWEGSEYRYSVSIYEMTDPGVQVKLKLVWFPQGYITERERPPPSALR